MNRIDILFKIKIEGDWVILSWKELNEIILFGNDLSNYEPLLYSGFKDKNNNNIFEGDIVSLIDDTGVIINTICRMGIVRRVMASGIEVDISSFYFEKSDGFCSYPITKNFMDKHDTESFEITGNIHD